MDIKSLQKTFGIPFIALIVFTIVFITPKILYDDVKYYMEMIKDKP